jgi:enoyl-CoA hydratase/carnithine racemase
MTLVRFDADGEPTITLNVPTSWNALSPELASELVDMKTPRRTIAHALVITGAGRASAPAAISKPCAVCERADWTSIH